MSIIYSTSEKNLLNLKIFSLLHLKLMNLKTTSNKIVQIDTNCSPKIIAILDFIHSVLVLG